MEKIPIRFAKREIAQKAAP